MHWKRRSVLATAAGVFVGASTGDSDGSSETRRSPGDGPVESFHAQPGATPPSEGDESTPTPGE